jgi:hypothetical protein
VKGVLQLYLNAVVHHYQPRSVNEESVLKGIVLWQLGGARVANFGHRALGLPGLSTLRRYSTMQPIIALYQFPSMGDIERNISTILSGGLLDTLKALSQDEILHLVLMVDEIALKKRIRWDTVLRYSIRQGV